MSKYEDKPFNHTRDGKVILINPGVTNDFLHIYYAGITLPNPLFRVYHNTNSRNVYHMYTFEYIVTGSGYIEADNKTMKVTQGDLFFLNRDRRQIYYSDLADPFQKIFIAVCGRMVDSRVEAYKIEESALVAHNECKNSFTTCLICLNEINLIRTISPLCYISLFSI